MKRKRKVHGQVKRGSSDTGGVPSRAKRRLRAHAVGPGARLSSKWAWHSRVLLGLRERLVAQRGERLKSAAEPMEAHSMDMADSATDEFDHDLALSALSTEQNALYEIDEALDRIRNGTYGVCQETAKPIPADRLRAIPWTRVRREAAEQLERRGVLNRPSLGPVGSVRGGKPGDLSESELDEERQAPSPEDESLHRVASASKLRVPSGRVPIGTRQKPRRPLSVRVARIRGGKSKASKQ